MRAELAVSVWHAGMSMCLWYSRTGVVRMGRLHTAIVRYGDLSWPRASCSSRSLASLAELFQFGDQLLCASCTGGSAGADLVVVV
jgi:hypothetical protein